MRGCYYASGGLRYARCGRSSPEKSSSNESRTASEGIGARPHHKEEEADLDHLRRRRRGPAALIGNADQGGAGRPESDLATVERGHGARRRRRRGVAVLSVETGTFSSGKGGTTSRNVRRILHFLGECACPEGVRKPDRRLAAALGPWASHPATNCVWWHERTKSESAREAQKNAELRGRDSLRRWIRHTLDVAAASREEDRTAAADAAARACLKLYAPSGKDLPDLSSARTLLLDEPWLRSGVEKERVRMRAKVPLPCLRWLPPSVDAPAVLAAANVFHGAKSYQQLQTAERQLRVTCEGEFTRRLKERAATDPDAFKKKKRRRRRRKSMDAPAPAPLKQVTFQTAQHATMAANIFAKKIN